MHRLVDFLMFLKVSNIPSSTILQKINEILYIFYLAFKKWLKQNIKARDALDDFN